MKNSLQFLFLLLLLINSKIFSQDTNITQYLPLQVGNSWTYSGEFYYYMHYCGAIEKYTIVGTQIINGHLFYVTEISLHESIYNNNNCGQFSANSRLFSQGYLRIDSTTYNIYGGSSCIIDSLAARNADSNIVCSDHTYYNPSHCDTSRYQIFGLNNQTKNFRCYTFEASVIMTYVKDLGLVHYHLYQPGPVNWDMTLQGCVINGTVYGDTSLAVGLINISNKIPNNFSLSQNYPNPFNPGTIIKFQIVSSSNAKLIIYDALGKEVQTLVDKKLEAGEYEANFDGTNLPSGVYFYKLEAGDYNETKKMVLIK